MSIGDLITANRGRSGGGLLETLHEQAEATKDKKTSIHHKWMLQRTKKLPYITSGCYKELKDFHASQVESTKNLHHNWMLESKILPYTTRTVFLHSEHNLDITS